MALLFKRGILSQLLLRGRQLTTKLSTKGMPEACLTCANESRYSGSWGYRRIHTSKFLSTTIELTYKRLPELKRGPYAEVTQKDIEYFETILGKGGVITDKDELEGYNIDWYKTCKGCSSVLLRPRTTEEVSKLLSYCNEQSLAVCPQGGNTGLVGGSVPVFDEIIMSTSLMNEVFDLDQMSGVLGCQAGCVLEVLEKYVGERNYMLPVDLGAKGSCQIGGIVSTNAGGLRLVRYGSLHGNVIGVEAVLPNGNIVDCMSHVRKDNTGYDLKQFFIGSEGTLGVVTKVALLCHPTPSAITVAFIACPTFEAVLKTFRSCREKLSEVLSAFEMMDGATMEAIEQNVSLRNPIGLSPFYVLIETVGSEQEHDEEKLASFLETAMENNIVTDGTMSSDPGHVRELWDVRERAAEALLHDGYVYSYDLSLPSKAYYHIVPVMKDRLGSKVKRCAGYGHVGDGNLHLNITTQDYDPEVIKLIEPFVYDWTTKNGGSISAEHGMGIKRCPYLSLAKSPNSIKLMKDLKALIDPKCILNPYKVFPYEVNSFSEF
ncbi:D-2-hydroxyglutarate dehydrogenase, mitochondrial-like [Limulus polyphemus]|uniref:D-2-hydroxyglutarate dehydrogenase, mitochondrial n=1 Tax=Limulus polyphemus TaxID=6850 RepID=A0ABM1BP79_LIMPO|nr:D-2-hydroxyglutarate dehydrogenase, mitochondrial-like [Limulus polyphemus]